MAIKIEKNFLLSKITTFQIGGKADYYCRVSGKDELIEALNWARENKQPFRVIGGGSNLLVSDNGYRGIVIVNRAGNFEIKGERVIAESGANLSKIARETVSQGYAGLDFATNIPGTIGGAAIGNAGAYGKDMSKCLLWAEIWEDGKLKDYLNDDFIFGYRASRFKADFSKIIITVTLELEKGDKEKMLALMDQDIAKRSSDYSGANAGSYFCNLETKDLTEEKLTKLNKFIVHDKVSVGKIIESLGLKGLKVGNAMVSENHGNVILNLGGAKASDVLELERTIIDKVLAAYGIILRPEVTKLGEF